MRILTSIFLILITSSVARADSDRVALIIGNNSYPNFSKEEQLANAVNDSDAIATSLRSKGFDVTLLQDATRIETLRALNSFRNSLDSGKIALVFYSGHGVEVGGSNYLLPSDTPQLAPSEKFLVDAAAISLTDVIAMLSHARASVLIVDACRNDPFEEAAARERASRGDTRGSVNRGLAGISKEPSGTFIVYSAGVKQFALDRLGGDDTDPNSVFTRVFLDEIEVPGRSIREIIVRTRSRVRDLALTAEPYPHDQFPAYYDQLTDDLILVPEKSDPVGLAFDAAIDSQRIGDLIKLVRQYPDHPKSASAQLVIKSRRVELLNRRIDEALRSQNRAALKSVADDAEGHARENDVKVALKLHEDIDTSIRQLDLSTLEALFSRLSGHPRQEQVRQAVRNGLFRDICGKLLSYGFACRNDLLAQLTDSGTTTSETAPISSTESEVELGPTDGSDGTDDERKARLADAGEAELAAATDDSAVSDDGDDNVIETEIFTGTRVQIRDIQARLSVLGHDAGKPDGIAGGKTRRAILAYERARGRLETGQITQDLFSRLKTEISDERVERFFSDQAAHDSRARAARLNRDRKARETQLRRQERARQRRLQAEQDAQRRRDSAALEKEVARPAADTTRPDRESTDAAARKLAEEREADRRRELLEWSCRTITVQNAVGDCNY